MDQQTLAGLLQRTFAQIDKGEPQMAPSDFTSDASRYTDLDRFERERSVLFRNIPNYAAHVSELPEAGSFVRRELGGVSALLVRGDDGVIRAFVNACRHRGTQLVADEQGCTRRFVCPYHAWSYARDGSLAGVPSEFGFPSLEHGRNGLVELPLWQRNGLLWVLPGGGNDFNFDAYWDPVADEIEALNLERATLYRPSSREWRANWKLIAEGGLESYHFQKTHAATIAPYFLTNQSIFDALGWHSRLFLPRSNIEEFRNRPLDGSAAAYYHVVYSFLPNLSLLVQEDHIALIVATPVAVDRTSVTVTLLVRSEDFTAKPESHWALNRKITFATLSEDFVIAEAIQKGLASGHLKQLRFGRFEHGLATLNRTIDTAMQELEQRS